MPIAVLKAKLSEHLDAVKAGEEIIVTERGEPIARLLPIAQEESLEVRMIRLVAAGLVRPPLHPLPDEFWTMPMAKDPEGLILKGLLEDREDDR
ncbi:MAG: type II toxin-antitoxin system Phd/YefM family antitoxin [bacterium]